MGQMGGYQNANAKIAHLSFIVFYITDVLNRLDDLETEVSFSTYMDDDPAKTTINENPVVFDAVKHNNHLAFNTTTGELYYSKIPGGIFGTPVGLDPDLRSQGTRTLGLTGDPPESQFQIVNTDNVD